jgi:hypothetical protein
MLPGPWLLLFALLLPGDAPSTGAEVRAQAGEVAIHAESLPLSELLDRLARATGMKVTYEGGRPAARVTVSLDGLSEVDAVVKLMEGTGLSYVYRTDATGRRVDLLIVSSSGGGLVASAEPSKHVDPPPEEPIEAFNHVPLDPAVAEAAGPQGPPDLKNPYLGLPPTLFPPGSFPDAPQGPVPTPGMPQPIPQPQFPQGASYPR